MCEVLRSQKDGPPYELNDSHSIYYLSDVFPVSFLFHYNNDDHLPKHYSPPSISDRKSGEEDCIYFSKGIPLRKFVEEKESLVLMKNESLGRSTFNVKNTQVKTDLDEFNSKLNIRITR